MKVRKSKDKRIKLKIERKQILKLFLEKMSPEFLQFSFQHFWRFSTKLGIRTKCVCRGLIGLHANFCNDQTLCRK